LDGLDEKKIFGIANVVMLSSSLSQSIQQEGLTTLIPSQLSSAGAKKTNHRGP